MEKEADESKIKKYKFEENLSKQVKDASNLISEITKETKKVVFGQDKIIEKLMRALLCNGSVLVEGVPGIAKTLLIRAFGHVLGCTTKRIQFTVDLLPTDIIGLTTYDQKKGFKIEKGPIFANFIIADEINRSPPKTQSALLEAMQEWQVTIGKQTFLLPLPFFVMATQNPIENEGVYSLPEAQIDRFLFKLLMEYPDKESEKKIMAENITFKRFEDFGLKEITNAEEIIALQKLVHKVYLDDKIKRYILDIIGKTRSKEGKYGQFIELGASPRASISAYVASKAQALIKGRQYATPQDVKEVVYDILRHRLMLSYRAKANNITSDMVIDDIVKNTKIPEI